MIDHRCPNCDRVIRSSDHLAGVSILCPHCHSTKVEVPEHSTVGPRTHPSEKADRERPAAAPVREYEEPRPEIRASRSVSCFVCGEVADGDTAYLRVNKRTVGAGRYTDRWITLRCSCCDRCYDRLRGLFWFRIGWALFGFIAFPALFCAGLPALLLGVGVAREVVVPVFVVMMLLSAAMYVITPLYLHFALRRRLFKLLQPSTVETLKSLGLGWTGGLTSELVPSRNPPTSGQPVIDVGGGGRHF